MIRLLLAELAGFPGALREPRLRAEFELLACVICRPAGPAELLVAYTTRRRLHETDRVPRWLLSLADSAVRHARRR
jgi:hypothetical protein